MSDSGGDEEEGGLRLDRRSGFVLRHSFDARPGSVSSARHAAERFLGRLADDCRPPDARAAGDVVLVVSELVTNVVRHTAGPGTLVMAYHDGLVRIVVRDTSTACMPSPGRVPRPDGRGGLGWPMVRALACAVTVVPLADGKEVHADMRWVAERASP